MPQSFNKLHIIDLLLTQLDSKRPRRDLDVDTTKQFLMLIRDAQEQSIETLLSALMESAWRWGASCEIDNVSWGEPGDSYNQQLRDETMAIASKLQLAFIASKLDGVKIETNSKINKS